MTLSFGELREVNLRRAQRWHGERISFEEPLTDGNWSGADWSNAAAGEMGETANVVKKLRRIDIGQPGAKDPDQAQLLVDLGDEIADTICYLDLLAAYYGINLGAAVREKFNFVSEREGVS